MHLPHPVSFHVPVSSVLVVSGAEYASVDACLKYIYNIFLLISPADSAWIVAFWSIQFNLGHSLLFWLKKKNKK